MGEGESKKSYFNAGMAQAERIDLLQRVLNEARFNLTMINPMFGKFNYEVMVFACEGLLKECWGKLDPEERLEGERLSKLMTGYMEVNPIIITNNNGETKVNHKNIKLFKQMLDLYENKIRVYLEEHDMNSPNKEEEDDDEL